jgi:pSer/pThr/pTyr-binding forkhead associated (FHA) protein
MDSSRTHDLGTRRWQVPASAQGNAVPRGFRPLFLKLPSQHIELELRQPEVLVGRHTLVDLCLPYPDVSRKHCRLMFSDDCWHIVDLGSLNGIEVNGERRNQADLHEGDTLRIANLKFEVHDEGGANVPMPPARPAQAQPILRQIASTLTAPNRAPVRRAS